MKFKKLSEKEMDGNWNCPVCPKKDDSEARKKAEQEAKEAKEAQKKADKEAAEAKKAKIAADKAEAKAKKTK